jgi:hypothetical protein
MAVSSRRAGALRWIEAINAYCAEQKGDLDKSALELLKRLANNPKAAEAFGQLKLDDRKVVPFLRTCLQAEDLARNKFSEWMAAAEKTLEDTGRLKSAVETLRRYVDEKITEHSRIKTPASSQHCSDETWPLLDRRSD